jgi:hypothetical protein
MGSVFISWSGSESETIARRLKDFLKMVLSTSDIFVSSEDIPGGKPWFTEIARAIDVSNAGVIIVTRASLLRPWLHFEAGAIAKHMDQTFVVPLLCGVPPGTLSGTPLAQFQALTLEKEGLYKLCEVLIRALESRVDELERRFNVWWEQLGEAFVNLPDAEPREKANPAKPDIADVSTQLERLAATVDSLASEVRNLRNGTAPAITGQGPLATASPADAARMVEPYLSPPGSGDLGNWGAQKRDFVVEKKKRQPTRIYPGKPSKRS